MGVQKLLQRRAVEQNVHTKNIPLGEPTAGILSTFLYFGNQYTVSWKQLYNDEFLSKGESYKNGKQEKFSWNDNPLLSLIREVGTEVSQKLINSE
jgi:hypothetical protein